jgi:tol-pal system protein YbgF
MSKSQPSVVGLSPLVSSIDAGARQPRAGGRRTGGRHFALVAALLLLSTGCFATRQDVRTLQDDLRLIRSESARDDTIRATQIARLNDSLAALSRRITRMNAETQGRFTAVEEQLLRTQEIAGQSQARVQEMRAALETARTASTEGPTGAPGPNQLYQLGREQFMRGSNAAARTAFQELLNSFPEADMAGDAQFFVGETFSAEGNTAAADSVYAIVVARYARSDRAATALYKRGVVAQQAGRNADARRHFNEVINRFPRSDEAALARDRLRTVR